MKYKKRNTNNRKCYYYEKIEKQKKTGIFDNVIDAVFIILLEGSKREENVRKQLKEYNLHSNIIIQYNKGYKKCNKELEKQETNFDLLDANYQIFETSKKMEYKNILVLEDDFLITPNINKTEYVESIKKIIEKDDYNLISLGGMFFMVGIKDINMTVPGVLTHAQAVIYSHRYFDLFMNKYYYDFKHVDEFTLVDKKYLSKIPIIIQSFPETENKKNWPKVNLFLWDILNKINNVDWNKYEGKELEYWDRYYKFFYINQLAVIVISLLIVSLSIYFIIKNKNKIKKIVKK